MKPGVKQTTDGLSECQWHSRDESEAVGVSVGLATCHDVLKLDSGKIDVAARFAELVLSRL